MPPVSKKNQLLGLHKPIPEILPTAHRAPKLRRNTVKTVFSYAACLALFCIVFLSPMVYVGMHHPHERVHEAARGTSMPTITPESRLVQKESVKKRGICNSFTCENEEDDANTDGPKDRGEVVTVAVAANSDDTDSGSNSEIESSQSSDAENSEDPDHPNDNNYFDPFQPTSPTNIVPVVSIGSKGADWYKSHHSPDTSQPRVEPV